METRKKRILFVDDSPEDRRLYSELMREWGYDVVIAKNGYEGIESALEQELDVVVLDFHMGRISGEEVMREIKDHRKKIPVIIHTGFPDLLGSFKPEYLVIKDPRGEGLKACLEEIFSK